MRIKLNKEFFKKEDLDILIVILFTFGVIGSKQIGFMGSNIYIEFITLASLYLVVKEIKYAKEHISEYKEKIKKYKWLIMPSLIMILGYIINGTRMNLKNIFFVTNKMYPYFFLLVIFLRFSRCRKEEIKKYIDITAKLFIITGLLGLVMYSLKITNGAFSLTKILNVQTFQESLDMYGEVRFYWLLSHKSRYVMYCLIGSLFVINSTLKKKVKFLGVGLITTEAILANSMIGLVIYFGVLVIAIGDKLLLIEKLLGAIKKNKIILVLILMGTLIVGVFAIDIVSKKRDLSSLGGRTFIWKAGMGRVKTNPQGIVEMPDTFWIKAYDEGYKYFLTNGHNMYINELIEGGVVLGSIYILVILLLILYYFKSRDIVFSSFLILFFLLYSNFEAINVKEMPYMVFFTFALMFWFKKPDDKKERKIGDEKAVSNNMHI